MRAVISITLGRKPSLLGFHSAFPFSLSSRTRRKRSDRLSAGDWSAPAEPGVGGKPREAARTDLPASGSCKVRYEVIMTMVVQR